MTILRARVASTQSTPVGIEALRSWLDGFWNEVILAFKETAERQAAIEREITMTDQAASGGVDPNSVRKVIQVNAPRVAWAVFTEKMGNAVAAGNVQNRQSECRGCRH